MLPATLLYSLSPHLCLILYFLSWLSLCLCKRISCREALAPCLTKNTTSPVCTYKYIFFCRSIIVSNVKHPFLFLTLIQKVLCVCVCVCVCMYSCPFYLFKCWTIFTSNLSISLQILNLQCGTFVSPFWLLE